MERGATRTAGSADDAVADERTSAEPLDYRILGPLEVARDGSLLALGGQKQRALLALLLIHAGEVMGTERLVDLLWGEQPPKTATTSLQNFVAQLRKVLPPEVLVTTPPGYVLRVADDQIDARRFERAAAEARAVAPEQRAELLREALMDWRGTPLADFTYESFAQAEILRLEELRLDALEERIASDLALGRGAEIVAELEGLVGQNPLRERLRGQLMLALYRAGRQAEALQSYHDGRRLLVEELGIEPGPDLQDLYRSILRQEDTLARTAPVHHDDDHFSAVAKALLTGRLVTVLGPEVGASADTPGTLPGPRELAAHLASVFGCPSEHARDLAHVAEYVAVTRGAGPLYDELHTLFDRDSSPGPAHEAVAGLAGALRARGAPRELLLTTNFDQLVEQAFLDAGEPLDVVVYLALGRHRGKFLHVGGDGTTTVVELPNAYTDLSLDTTNVLFKLHGGIDRHPDRAWDSFVVSEDDYIDYLAQADISVVIPVTLAARLRRSHFLFLGYPLQEWSLRVFLHRLFGQDEVAYRSWAIRPGWDEVERDLWRRRGIDVFDIPVDEYLARLRARVEAEAGR